MLDAASGNARLTRTGRISEVSWLVEFHAAVQATLGAALGAAVGAAGAGSLALDSIFAHGRPFQVTPTWPYGGSVEIGDLLLVVDRVDDRQLVQEREALLLQIKFNKPALASTPTRGKSDARQAELFATWPDFDWTFSPINTVMPHPPRRSRSRP